MVFDNPLSSLLTSNIWQEDHPTKILWITLVGLANRKGVVVAGVAGLTAIARLTIEETRAGLEILTSNDPAEEPWGGGGNGLEVVPGGWRIIGYGQEEFAERLHRQNNRIRQKRFQDEKKARKARSAELKPIPPEAEARTNGHHPPPYSPEEAREVLEGDNDQPVPEGPHECAPEASPGHLVEECDSASTTRETPEDRPVDLYKPSRGAPQAQDPGRHEASEPPQPAPRVIAKSTKGVKRAMAPVSGKVAPPLPGPAVTGPLGTNDPVV